MPRKSTEPKFLQVAKKVDRVLIASGLPLWQLTQALKVARMVALEREVEKDQQQALLLANMPPMTDEQIAERNRLAQNVAYFGGRR